MEALAVEAPPLLDPVLKRPWIHVFLHLSPTARHNGVRQRTACRFHNRTPHSERELNHHRHPVQELPASGRNFGHIRWYSTGQEQGRCRRRRKGGKEQG